MQVSLTLTPHTGPIINTIVDWPPSVLWPIISGNSAGNVASSIKFASYPNNPTFLITNVSIVYQESSGVIGVASVHLVGKQASVT